MLGQIYERNERKDFAAYFYTRIVKDYPLSPLAADAKGKLTKLGAPIPQPDPTALARMQKEQNTPRQKAQPDQQTFGSTEEWPRCLDGGTSGSAKPDAGRRGRRRDFDAGACRQAAARAGPAARRTRPWSRR